MIHIDFNRRCLSWVEIFPLHEHGWIRLDHVAECIRVQCHATFSDVMRISTNALRPLNSALLLNTRIRLLDLTALTRCW